MTKDRQAELWCMLLEFQEITPGTIHLIAQLDGFHAWTTTSGLSRVRFRVGRSQSLKHDDVGGGGRWFGHPVKTYTTTPSTPETPWSP